MTSDNKNKSNAMATLVVIIIFVLIVVVGSWAAMKYQKDSAQPYIDRGCEPEAFGFLGSVSIWNCP